MMLLLSPLQIEIALAAVSHHKTLSQHHAALSRRLELTEVEAKDQLAANTFLRSALDKLAAVPLASDQAHALDIPAPMAARAFRVALIQWVALATTRDKSAHGATLTTDLGARRSAAQNLVDQLSEQLSLPIEDLSSLVARTAGKEQATRKGKETPTLGTDARQLKLVDDAPPAKPAPVDWDSAIDADDIGEDDIGEAYEHDDEADDE